MLLKRISFEPPNGSHERRTPAPALPEKPFAFAGAAIRSQSRMRSPGQAAFTGVFRCFRSMAEKLSMLLSNNEPLPFAVKLTVLTLVLYNQIPFISTANSNLVRYVSNKMRFFWFRHTFYVLKNIFMFFLIILQFFHFSVV